MLTSTPRRPAPGLRLPHRGTSGKTRQPSDSARGPHFGVLGNRIRIGANGCNARQKAQRYADASAKNNAALLRFKVRSDHTNFRERFKTEKFASLIGSNRTKRAKPRQVSERISAQSGQNSCAARRIKAE
ncbi:hypothetical protein AAKU55_002912 [Oxalobacteraceae bacterium GrIS 1.11]